jgi:hypothetical protein
VEGGKSGVNARIVIEVVRELFILFFCATIAVLLGNGYYKSFRSGVLTVRGHTFKGYTSRRDKEPISYWIGMAVGIFAFLVMVSGAALMAFLVCMDLFRKSK